jgi:hypothetical protein
MNLKMMLRLIACLPLLAILAGCGSKPAAPPVPRKTAEDHAKEIEQAMAKLSPEDRAVAQKQKVCPVTDVELGSSGMGTPVKIELQGQTFFLCCDSCREEATKNSEKYLAKLGLSGDAAAKKPL